MTSLSSRLLASCLTLTFVLPACAGAPADTDVVVRRATIDGPLTHAELELDGDMRRVVVLERDDGERVIVLSDAAWYIRAVAQTDGDDRIDFDPAAGLAAIAPCDGTCAPLDAVSAELLDLVIDEAIDFDAPLEAWREVASQAEKRLEQQRQDLIKNWAG